MNRNITANQRSRGGGGENYLVEEKMIAMRHPRIVEKLYRQQQRITKPFGQNFEAVVRSLGITELRRAA